MSPHEPSMFLVSNRLPVTAKRQADGTFQFVRSPGGLVSGLSDVHKQQGAIWLGHSGFFVDSPEYGEVSRSLATQRYVAVPLAGDDYKAYYNGLANGALWPLCHYFLQEARFDQDDWKAYVKVNRVFAEQILALARPGDRVWVHDYQLMLLPGMLREQQPELLIAYFHHIPFPSCELFRTLPWRIPVVQGLLGADLIGMHTLDYVMHFQSSVARLLGVDVERDQIHYKGRRVRLGAFPLGVDIASVKACVRGLADTGRVAELAKSSEGKTVFLGIDRLDYMKGIVQRLRSFQLFLRDHPEVLGNVLYVQVCVPSREDVPSYASLRAEVERLVGQINGEFGQPGYAPLHYLYQPFTPDEVRQFYKLGDVALVTPLRDGLNLVCKEYVAARDDGDGVLVLSEFAGAAAEMGEALLVNPFDVAGLARAMHEAYVMPPAERQRRMRHLRRRVTANDSLEWSRTFLRAWADVPAAAAGKRSRQLDGDAAAELVTRLCQGRKVKLFLDYDGTLVPIRSNPSLAVPSISTLRLLYRLGSLPMVNVALITGRSRQFCEQYFANLPLWMAAEHSCFLRAKGLRSWQATVDPRDFHKMRSDVLPHLESYVSRIPGATIEEKMTALVLHYREAESIFAHRQAYDLRESLCRLLANTPYSAFQAKKAIEVKPISANKGYAVERILDMWGHDGDFLTAGDDRTDEDMFRVAPERNHSVYVGDDHMIARYHVDAPEDLERLLQALAARLGGSEREAQAHREDHA